MLCCISSPSWLDAMFHAPNAMKIEKDGITAKRAGNQNQAHGKGGLITVVDL